MLLTCINNVLHTFPWKHPVMDSLFCATNAAVWTECVANAQHSRCELISFKDDWRPRVINLGVFTVRMMRHGVQHHFWCSICLTWVCIQGFGLSYCIQMSEKRSAACCSLWRETFGYPQVADGSGCDWNVFVLLKMSVGFRWSLTYKTWTPRKVTSHIFHHWEKKQKKSKRFCFITTWGATLRRNSSFVLLTGLSKGLRIWTGGKKMTLNQKDSEGVHIDCLLQLRF